VSHRDTILPSFLEPRVRVLVAETLGVDAAELSPHVSLTDDLAADSLDLTEVAVRLESEVGIALPDAVVDCIRTYGDLVRAAVASFGAPPAAPETRPVPIWTRLVSSGGELLRADFLTPYVAETLAEDAVRAGRGARLEVRLGAMDDACVARLREELAWLARHGVDVSVARRGRGQKDYPTAA
jgi:acyl carrier protein